LVATPGGKVAVRYATIRKLPGWLRQIAFG
jgi:hypothetical protein